jgi:hypothetical protein
MEQSRSNFPLKCFRNHQKLLLFSLKILYLVIFLVSHSRNHKKQRNLHISSSSALSFYLSSQKYTFLFYLKLFVAFKSTNMIFLLKLHGEGGGKRVGVSKVQWNRWNWNFLPIEFERLHCFSWRVTLSWCSFTKKLIFGQLAANLFRRIPPSLTTILSVSLEDKHLNHLQLYRETSRNYNYHLNLRICLVYCDSTVVTHIHSEISPTTSFARTSQRLHCKSQKSAWCLRT